MAVLAVGIALAVTEQRLLLLVGLVAAWRALATEPGPGDPQTLTTYVGLAGALSWVARGIH